MIFAGIPIPTESMVAIQMIHLHHMALAEKRVSQGPYHSVKNSYAVTFSTAEFILKTNAKRTWGFLSSTYSLWSSSGSFSCKSEHQNVTAVKSHKTVLKMMSQQLKIVFSLVFSQTKFKQLKKLETFYFSSNSATECQKYQAILVLSLWYY